MKQRTKEDLINEFVARAAMGSDNGKEIYKLLEQQKIECMVSPSGQYQIVLVAPPFKNMGMEIIEKDGESRIQVSLEYNGARFNTTFPIQKGVKLCWVSEVSEMKNINT